MMNIILVALLVVALVGWLKNKIGIRTMACYMVLKNYAQPSDAEAAACARIAIESLLGVKGRNGR